MKTLIALILTFGITQVQAEDGRGKEYLPSHVKLKKTIDDEGLDGLMCIQGLVKTSWGDTLKGRVQIAFDGLNFKEIEGGTFNFLLGTKSDSIKEITFHGEYHEPAKFKMTKFQANRHLVLEVTLVEYMIEMEKPVIYLYSDVQRDIELSLEVNGIVDFSYPRLDQGKWQVHLNGKGGLFHNGEAYAYLFYDTKQTPIKDLINSEDVSIVSKDNYLSFLETKLSNLGLNDSERNDFIVYWMPRLLKNEMSELIFKSGVSYDDLAKIKSSEKFDSMLRVFMTIKPSNAGHESYILGDKSNFDRSGLTLVEWGGSEIKLNKLP